MEEITLKKFRKSQNCSQLEFADKMGCTQALISSIEVSKRKLTEDFLEKLDEVFQYKIKGYKIVASSPKNNKNNNNVSHNDLINSSIFSNLDNNILNSLNGNDYSSGFGEININNGTSGKNSGKSSPSEGELIALKMVVDIQKELIEQLRINIALSKKNNPNN